MHQTRLHAACEGKVWSLHDNIYPVQHLDVSLEMGELSNSPDLALFGCYLVSLHFLCVVLMLIVRCNNSTKFWFLRHSRKPNKPGKPGDEGRRGRWRQNCDDEWWQHSANAIDACLCNVSGFLCVAAVVNYARDQNLCANLDRRPCDRSF